MYYNLNKILTLYLDTDRHHNFNTVYNYRHKYAHFSYSRLTSGNILRSEWPRGLRRRSAATRLPRSCVRIPPRAWMFVCCECCVLSCGGLCDGLITRPEESYLLWCVIVCDLETSWMRGPWPTGGLSRQKQTNPRQNIWNMKVLTTLSAKLKFRFLAL